MNFDRHILKLLKKKGSNFRRTHAVEFYVYFKGKAAAKKAAVLIKKQGFHVELLSDSSGKRWICLSIREMFPRYKIIQKFKNKLNALAKPWGGHCDSWGTQVEK
jgi:regulator of RNase E activity RraB